jgi:hypothetical protein
VSGAKRLDDRGAAPLGDDGERGLALLVAIMALLFMAALGGSLMMTTMTETRISNNFRNSSEGLYAADAALERALSDLAAVADWNAALAGAPSAFVDGPIGVRELADGRQLDLNHTVNDANCQKTICAPADYSAVTATRPWGANNPRWQLFAYGPLNDMAPAGLTNSPFYVLVLIADDSAENDDNPLLDGSTAGNPGSGVVMLRAEAFGPRGVHKTIEATVVRAAAGLPALRVLSWRQLR